MSNVAHYDQLLRQHLGTVKLASTMLDAHSQAPAAKNHRENKRRFKALAPPQHKEASFAYHTGAAQALEDLGFEKTAILGALMAGARAMAPTVGKAVMSAGRAGGGLMQAGKGFWAGGAKAALPGLQQAGNQAMIAGRQLARGARAGWQAAKPGLQQAGGAVKGLFNATTHPVGQVATGTVSGARGGQWMGY